MNKLKYEDEIFGELDKQDLMDPAYIKEVRDWWIIKINGKLYVSTNGKFAFPTEKSAKLALRNGLFGSKLHMNILNLLYNQKHKSNRFDSKKDFELEATAETYVNKYIKLLVKNKTIQFLQLYNIN